MEKVIEGLIVFAIAAAVVLGIWWLFWSLWCWVLPQVWATGPENIIRPSYWLFVGALLLAGLVGRVLFGGRGKK